MATHVTQLVQHVRHMLRGDGLSQRRDRELVDGFARSHAPDAFAVLVERHGPMVLGVCRRVLQNTHDADDAFQATFLVLARQVGRLRKPESLAAWLHGIALRLALNMKREASKRRQRESHAQSRQSSPLPDLGARELHAALDEELQCLPENHRQPLLLCYFEGLTQEAAAHQLGWPRGTLKRRLERGRDLLRERLTRRGLTLGATLLGTVTAGEALAIPLPASLATATVQTATAIAVGHATAGAASVKAVALADGVMKAMFLARLGKVIAIALLAIIGCGLGVLGYSRAGAGQNADVESFVQSTDAFDDKKQDAPPAKADAELIQGVWKVVKTEHNGKMLPREASVGDDQIWHIGAGKITVRYAAAGTKEITYQLDAKAKPKAVDVTIADEAGSKYLGIYALDGDRLQFAYCRNTAPTAERYKSFFRDDLFDDRGRRYFLLERVKPKARTKEEATKLEQQFKANADSFELYLSRHRFGSTKVDLQSICLHASNRRFEPSVIGPSGKPIFKSARITKEQALKLIEVLDGFPAAIFRTEGPRAGSESAWISTRITYGPDAQPGPTLEVRDWWGWHMIGQFMGIGECLDGDAAKLVSELFDAIGGSANPPGKKDGKNDTAKLRVIAEPFVYGGTSYLKLSLDNPNDFVVALEDGDEPTWTAAKWFTVLADGKEIESVTPGAFLPPRVRHRKEIAAQSRMLFGLIALAGDDKGRLLNGYSLHYRVAAGDHEIEVRSCDAVPAKLTLTIPAKIESAADQKVPESKTPLRFTLASMERDGVTNVQIYVAHESTTPIHYPYLGAMPPSQRSNWYQLEVDGKIVKPSKNDFERKDGDGKASIPRLNSSYAGTLVLETENAKNRIFHRNPVYILLPGEHDVRVLASPLWAEQKMPVPVPGSLRVRLAPAKTATPP